MRALSIKQPWAWLILHAGKNIENRVWRTNFRGEILIHASKEIDADAYVCENRVRGNTQLPEVEELELQGIVGIATIVDCVTTHTSRWFEGPYGFVLENVRPLPFVPCKGSLGFWKVPGEVLKEIHTA